MAGETYVKELFARTIFPNSQDIAVIEGVMGLFDGADPADFRSSAAEIACWLDAPVLLVVNTHGLAGSVAALVKGYADFIKTRLHMVGIIANQCGSERHEAWLAASLSHPFLPWLGRSRAMPCRETHSRHLGLITADSRSLPEDVLGKLASALERYVPLEGIVKIAGSAPALTCVIPDTKPLSQRYAIGVARDGAFHFYYQDLFDTLERNGCTVKFFSPVADARLPEGIDALFSEEDIPRSMPGICGCKTGQ